MFPIEHPETILLIHEEMVQRELGRNSPAGLRETRGPEPRIVPISGLRQLASTTLIAIGTRIAPARHPGEPAPSGARMSTTAFIEKS